MTGQRGCRNVRNRNPDDRSTNRVHRGYACTCEARRTANICAGLIADGIGRWADSIASTHGLHPNDYIAAFVAGTDYLPAIRRWTPDLLEELKGIARGSGQPWEWIYAFNLLDEEWTWAKKQGQELPPGCTAVGFATDGKTPTPRPDHGYSQPL